MTDPRQLEMAAEFCKVAGKSNLVEYLGLQPGCTSEEAIEALKRRRRYMQGMQSNPKYKTEALQLIRNYSAFQAILADPASYMKDARRKAETVHLPVLEMTIRGALRGGALSPEQVEYLRRNATELGVGEDTFIGTLDRLMVESGVQPLRATESPPPNRNSRRGTSPPTLLPTDSNPDYTGPRPGVPPASQPGQNVPPVPTAPKASQSTPAPANSGRSPTPSLSPMRLVSLPGLAELEVSDHYQVLGIPRSATRAEIREAYQERVRVARATLPPDVAEKVLERVDGAWSVLQDAGAREAYDLSRRATGPPARDREVTDPQGFRPSSPLAGPTAPPVRPRTQSPRPRTGGDEPNPTSSSSSGSNSAIRAFAPANLEVEESPTRPLPKRGIEVQGSVQRVVKVAGTPVNLPLRLTLPLDDTNVRLTSDEDWAVITPERLEGGRSEVEVSVRIDPAAMRRTTGLATILVLTDKGERATVTFDVERQGTSSAGIIAAGVIATALMVTVLLLLVVYLKG